MNKVKIQPDNKIREERAFNALQSYIRSNDLNSQDKEENVTDLITDLLHYVDHNLGIDPLKLLGMAKEHFLTERD